MADELIDFDSVMPQAVRFRHDGKEYVLKEAGSGGVMKWQAAVMRSLILREDGGRMPSETTNETRFVLLSWSVWRAGERPEDRKPDEAFPEEELKLWPNRVTKELFDKAKRLCGEHEDVDTLEGLKARRDGIIKRIAALEAEGKKAEEKAGPKG